MKTKIINLKQFRQNITKLWKEARKENIRFIVMFHSTPILEVLPCKDDYFSFESSSAKSTESNIEFYKEEKSQAEITEVEKEQKNPNTEIKTTSTEVLTKNEAQPLNETLNNKEEIILEKNSQTNQDSDYINFTTNPNNNSDQLFA